MSGRDQIDGVRADVNPGPLWVVPGEVDPILPCELLVSLAFASGPTRPSPAP